MIIDRVDLTGDSAYFRTAAGAVNLVNSQGSIASTGEGLALNVAAIHFYFEKSDLSGLWRKQANPLVTVEISKEMFPKLLTDPYSSRVHTIGGFEDFRRGVSSNCRPMEVDGAAMLVSVGAGQATWTSQVYQLPEAVNFDKAAWDVGTSRLGSGAAFSYSLFLDFWDQTTPVFQNPTGSVTLAANAPANTDRVAVAAGGPNARLLSAPAAAYRARLQADVALDSYLRERLVGNPLPLEPLVGASAMNTGMGRPVLRAIYLIERTSSTFALQSLAEIVAAGADYHPLEFEAKPLRRMMVMLPVAAVLTVGESITVKVSNDFDYAEARLEAEIITRPPQTT
jgi:hypothetical protein